MDRKPLSLRCDPEQHSTLLWPSAMYNHSCIRQVLACYRYHERDRGCILTTPYWPAIVQCNRPTLRGFTFSIRCAFFLRFGHACSSVLAKFNNSRRVKQYSLDEDVLWFATRRGLRRSYVPASLRTDTLRKSHDHELSGRGGTNNTVERVSSLFCWPDMRPAARVRSLLSGLSAAKTQECYETRLTTKPSHP